MTRDDILYRDRLNDNSFRSNLIKVLRDIHIELRRSNELHEQSNKISKEGNESFYKEQAINREIEEEALSNARNLNNNFKALKRKVEKAEREADTEAGAWI